MSSVEQKIFAHGVVPVVTIHRVEDAVPLCSALSDGGLPLAEITFRTEAAAEAIRTARRDLPEVLVGAGTVTSIALAEQALAAGAEFIVTPGYNPEVITYCLSRGIPVYPGCTTASEVEGARNLGLRTVKFFPAEQSGGLDRIKALSGPYPDMLFMPTGGISPANLTKYLASPLIVACGGTFMVPPALVDAGDWEGVRRLTREGLLTALGARLTCAGPVLEGMEERTRTMETFAAVTGQDAMTENGSPGCVAEPGSGATFRMCFTVTSLARSLAYLELRSIAVDPSTLVTDRTGRPQAVCLLHKAGGCHIELCQA